MLSEYIRKRVPESDVDDVVQTVLVEALASDRVPSEKAELRKWLTGVARHKIADHHRRAGRERPAELPDIETAPAPIEEQELARWAEKQARASKDGDATLRWMAREGEGDKLEHIAAEEKLPAATVRQRVSRMRRWMKERWLAEVAAAAAILTLLIVLLYKFVFLKSPDEVVEKEPVVPPVPTESVPSPIVRAPSPLERAVELRKEALKTCDEKPKECIDKLDEAKRLDPAGDTNPDVQNARRGAEDKLAPPQAPTSEPLDEKQKKDSMEKGPAPTARPPTTSTPIAPPTSTGKPMPKAPKAPSKKEAESSTKPQSASSSWSGEWNGASKDGTPFSSTPSQMAQPIKPSSKSSFEDMSQQGAKK